MSKFKKGDLCKIVSIYDTSGMTFPNPFPSDKWKLGLIVRIVGNYGSLIKNSPFLCRNANGSLIKNTWDYRVEVPPEYNPQCYNDKGEWEYEGMYASTHLFGWSWVQEDWMELYKEEDWDDA